MTDEKLAEDGMPVKVWIEYHSEFWGRLSSHEERVLNNLRCVKLWVKHNISEEWYYDGIHAKHMYCFSGPMMWSMQRETFIIDIDKMGELYKDWVLNLPAPGFTDIIPIHWWDNDDEQPECADNCKLCRKAQDKLDDKAARS
tara:strand:- start:683 stop:1108 length:426 start_codon:yes stop_codon:yes gene_type:complete